jgi:hypothetical protein
MAANDAMGTAPRSLARHRMDADAPSWISPRPRQLSVWDPKRSDQGERPALWVL